MGQCLCYTPTEEMILLNNFEKLEDFAEQSGVDIIPRHFESKRIKGLYCDRTIALNDSIRSYAEKTCVLAEELGHHQKTVGNILDQQNIVNRKQERRARLWAYDKLVSLFGIIEAYNAGCRNLYEMAEYLEITEEFLKESLDVYKSKYGTCVRTKEFILFFYPTLAVMKVQHK